MNQYVSSAPNILNSCPINRKFLAIVKCDITFLYLFIFVVLASANDIRVLQNLFIYFLKFCNQTRVEKIEVNILDSNIQS